MVSGLNLARSNPLAICKKWVPGTASGEGKAAGFDADRSRKIWVLTIVPSSYLYRNMGALFQFCLKVAAVNQGHCLWICKLTRSCWLVSLSARTPLLRVTFLFLPRVLTFVPIFFLRLGKLLEFFFFASQGLTATAVSGKQNWVAWSASEHLIYYTRQFYLYHVRGVF